MPISPSSHVVDFTADVGKTPLGALETLLGTGEILARGAGCLESCAGIAVSRRQCVLSLLQPIGAGTAFSLRGLHLGDQGAAFFREYPGRVFQFGAIAPGLGDTLLERGDLRAGALLAFDPAVLVRSELR